MSDTRNLEQLIIRVAKERIKERDVGRTNHARPRAIDPDSFMRVREREREHIRNLIKLTRNLLLLSNEEEGGEEIECRENNARRRLSQQRDLSLAMSLCNVKASMFVIGEI